MSTPRLLYLVGIGGANEPIGQVSADCQNDNHHSNQHPKDTGRDAEGDVVFPTNISTLSRRFHAFR